MGLSYKDLCELLGKVVPTKELKDKMFLQKMEVERIVSAKGCVCNTKLIYDETNDQYICPNCGYQTRRLAEASAFCPKCRSKIVREESGGEFVRFFCPTKGCEFETINPVEVAFCPNCSVTIEYDVHNDLWICPNCKSVDSTAEQYASEWTIEVTFDRPDLLSTEGVARELRGILGIETGLPEYKVQSSSIEVHADPSVKYIRPFIQCAVLRNIDCSDDFIRQMMQLQEKLHESFCRERRKASIGIYDLDTFKQFPIKYAGLPPEEIRFIPLEEVRPMTGIQILEETEKGVKYADLLKDSNGNYSGYFPVLIDSSGMVLSLPPIINSESTKVTAETRNLFVDVTGLDDNVIGQVLNVVVTNLCERYANKGGEILTVEIRYDKETKKTPDLATRKMILHIDYARDILGIELTSSEIVELLKKMRLGTGKIGENEIEVLIPPYRVDFLHEVDIIEDLAIAYGYSNIQPSLPPLVTVGKELHIETITSKVCNVMTGLGFQQVLTYTMTDSDTLFKNMCLPVTPVVEVSNPKSARFCILRASLLPGLMEFLSINQSHDLPQRIFEIGDVAVVDESQLNKARNIRKIAGVIINAEISFEDIQAVVYNFLHNLGLDIVKDRRIKVGKVENQPKAFVPKKSKHPSFIHGRVAELIVDGSVVGILGEIHPKVILNFGMSNPIVAFELDMSCILEKLGLVF